MQSKAALIDGPCPGHVHLLGMVNAKVEDLFKIPLATRVARCIKCLEVFID